MDCKIYNDLINPKSIHQLSGPLIPIPVWYINNFTIIKTLKTQTFALQCKIDPSTYNTFRVYDWSVYNDFKFDKEKLCIVCKIYDGNFISVPMDASQ